MEFGKRVVLSLSLDRQFFLGSNMMIDSFFLGSNMMLTRLTMDNKMEKREKGGGRGERVRVTL